MSAQAEPAWLHATSIASLLLTALCALSIVFDLLRHPQRMWIMNPVWPLTAKLAGFVTARPVNAWLLRKGFKEKM